MRSIRHLVFFLPLLSGCALIPPGRSSLVGTHTAFIGFNQGASVVLNPDGTYRRTISLFYCEPLVMESEDGKTETFSGWTNSETGTWTVSDRAVCLEVGDRDIQNPNVEGKYFDEVRSYPITYKFPHGWMLIYPNWKCVLMKKRPNKALAPTPMSVTPAADAPVAPATDVAHL